MSINRIPFDMIEDRNSGKKLNTKLDEVTSQLAEKAKQTDLDLANQNVTANTTALAGKADKTALNTAINEILAPYVYRLPQAYLTQFKTAIVNKSCTVVFWGDSITEGANFIDANEKYAIMFQNALQQRFPDVAFTFINYGIGGANITNAADSTYVSPTNFSRSWSSTAGKSWRDYVRDANPDLLFIAFGMNKPTDTAGNKTALDSIKTFMGTWSKIPSTIFLTNWLPRLGYVDQANIDFGKSIMRSTREWAKNNGYAVLDIGRIYRLIKDGVDETTRYAYQEKGFGVAPDWGYPSDGTITGDSTTKSFAAYKFAERLNLPCDFKIKATFNLTGTNIPKFIFRSVMIVQLETSGQLAFFETGTTPATQRTPVTGYGTGSHSITIEMKGANMKAYFDDVLVIDKMTYQDFKDGSVKVGYDVGGGTVTNLEITQFKPMTVTPIATDDDIVGTLTVGDYSTKMPYGGNGANHPTSKAVKLLYSKPLESLLSATNGW